MRKIWKLLAGLAAAAGLLTAGLLIGWQWATAEFHDQSPRHQHDPGSQPDEADNVEYWTCTMHPSVKMATQEKCPICAMDLVAVQKKEAVSLDGAPSRSALEATADRSLFEVDPRRQQLINVQTTPVELRPMKKVVRTVANLELDETRIRHVHPRISGWIQQVYVDFTLRHVQKGEPLFSIYSPELVASQEEYLLALQNVGRLGRSSFDFVSDGAHSLLKAARRRLALFEVGEAQIKRLEQSGKVLERLTVYSPVSGHVMEKNAFENKYVTPETAVYSVADHSRIWAQAEIYENDISHVHEGQQVTMTVPAFPGRRFRGKIAYLYPHLNEETRTVRARLEFPNPDLKLKPKMYADIEIEVPLGRRLAVPVSAVLRTGTRDLVFVDLGGGTMQLRRVGLGVQASGFYEVLKGLEQGETVISAANFLIDAESRVQGVEASWETPKPRGAATATREPQ